MKINNLKLDVVIGLIIFLLGLFVGWRILAPKKLITDKENNKYVVISVIDGDTFRINNKQRVRLLGIDSPEKGECYYQEATKALTNLIEGQTVVLEKDISDKDKYGRWLRYAILQKEEVDNILVNDYMVRNGFALATAIPPDKHYRELLRSAQQEAIRKKIGLWSVCNYQEKDESALREQDSQPTNSECVIKGNISEKGYGKTYLVPGCDNYERVKIDTRKGESYFCTEAEAQAAGFRKATNCP